MPSNDTALALVVYTKPVLGLARSSCSAQLGSARLLACSLSPWQEGTTAYQTTVPGVGRHSIHLGGCR